MGPESNQYPAISLFIECRKCERVEPVARTDRDIGLGDPFEKVFAAYGQHYEDLTPYKMDGIEYELSHGLFLRFERDSRSRIRKITVMSE